MFFCIHTQTYTQRPVYDVYMYIFKNTIYTAWIFGFGYIHRSFCSNSITQVCQSPVALGYTNRVNDIICVDMRPTTSRIPQWIGMPDKIGMFSPPPMRLGGQL